MKTAVLYLSLILLISSVSYSQNEDGFEKSPIYIDQDGKVSDSYFDIDFNPNDALVHKTEVGSDFVPGIFYDKYNNRTEGSLSFNLGGDDVIYKVNQFDNSTKKFHPTECKGFSLLNDSFTVLSNFTIEKANRIKLVKKSVFVAHIADWKNYSLLKYTDIGDVVINTYLIKNKVDGNINFVPADSIKERNSLNYLTKDFLWLNNKIASERFKTKDMPNVFKWLDYYDNLKSQLPVYYDRYFNLLKDSGNYQIKQSIINFNEGIWTIAYQNKAGDTLMVGEYSNLVPLEKEGVCKWYYPNGKIKKIATYHFDKINGLETHYFEDGNVHYDLAVTTEKEKETFFKALKRISEDGLIQFPEIESKNHWKLKSRQTWINGQYVSYSYWEPYDQGGGQKSFFNDHPTANSNEDDKITISYLRVNDINGNNLLDSIGNGEEVVYDSLLERTVYRMYKSNNLENSYFISDDNNKVYQYCQVAPQIKGFKNLNLAFNEKFQYPMNAIKDKCQGVGLVRLLIDNKGGILSSEFVKSIHPEMNIKTQVFIKQNFTSNLIKEAKVDKERVFGEIVVPFKYLISGYNPSSVYYNNYMWMNNMMWMNNQMMWQQNKMMNVPKFAPAF